MPRVDDPRITIRLSPADHAVFDAAAESCGVETGSLIREAALRSAAAVARDVLEGRLVLRRRRGTGAARQSDERSDAASPVPPGSDPCPAVSPAIMFRRASGLL